MSEEKKYYKEQSKLNWYTNGNITVEQLQLGCLQRIADAMEIIAKDNQKLIDEAKHQKERSQYWHREWEKMDRRGRAYKGMFNRLKKQLKK